MPKLQLRPFGGQSAAWLPPIVVVLSLPALSLLAPPWARRLLMRV